MPLYGVQRASSKTDRQVIDKECFENVLGNTKGQLINLQSKTCHSQDTASWNTFLWVEFVRECCPNSDSDSPVPEIFRHENRQSASKANPVKVSDDAILPVTQSRCQMLCIAWLTTAQHVFQPALTGRLELISWKNCLLRTGNKGYRGEQISREIVSRELGPRC